MEKLINVLDDYTLSLLPKKVAIDLYNKCKKDLLETDDIDLKVKYFKIIEKLKVRK